MEDAAAPSTGRRDAEGKVLEAPESFMLMLLHPTRVHYLRLTDNFAQLDQLISPAAADGAAGGEWSAARVNP